jgi:hypothetical protein
MNNELQAFGAVATGLKPAIDLAQSVLNLVGAGKGRDDALKLYGQVVAAHQSALTAQASQEALLKEKRQLEEELGRLKDWNAEKQRYQLQDVGQRCMAYALKPGMENGEPPHSICATCYQEGRKSILVPFHISIGRGEALQCHVCGSEMVVSGVDGREGARIAYRAPAAGSAGGWGRTRR